MASDRRLRSTSSGRGADDLGRRGRARRGRSGPVAEGSAARQQRGPRPDGLPGSLRAAAGRSETMSTRRVPSRLSDGRGRSRWRPYAPGTASTQEWWGPGLFGDSRPLVTELSSHELAEEALTALRADRTAAPEEPWLLDMEAIGPATRSVPRHAAAGSRRPPTAPRPAAPSPSSTTHRHRRQTAPGRRSAARTVWIAVTGVAVAVAVGLGWTVAFGAHDVQPGPGSEVPAPVTAPASTAGATGEPASPSVPASPAASSSAVAERPAPQTTPPAASNNTAPAGPESAVVGTPTAAASTPSAARVPTAATKTPSDTPALDAPPAVVVTLG